MSKCVSISVRLKRMKNLRVVWILLCSPAQKCDAYLCLAFSALLIQLKLFVFHSFILLFISENDNFGTVLISFYFIKVSQHYF